MPYVKTHTSTQRKGAAFFTNNTYQYITSTGEMLYTPFENMRYNSAPEVITREGPSQLRLQQGYVFRIFVEVLATSSSPFELNIVITDLSGNQFPTTINSGGLTPTMNANALPFASASGIIDTNISGTTIVCLRVSYLTPGVSVTLSPNSVRVYIEVLEAYTIQSIDIVYCRNIHSLGIYNNTTSNGPNLFIDAGGLFYRSTSSIKYKKDVEDLDTYYSKKIYGLRPVWYRSQCGGDRQDWSWYGLIAEEVSAIEPRLCIYNKEGEPDGVDYARLSVLLLKELQLMRAEVDELKQRLSALKAPEQNQQPVQRRRRRQKTTEDNRNQQKTTRTNRRRKPSKKQESLIDILCHD